jgi:hypothetical protein
MTFDPACRLRVSLFLGRASLAPANAGLSLKSQPRLVVVLKLPEGKAPLLIVRARAILVAMTGSPSLAEVEAATDALFESEAKKLTRVVDSVTERDAKRMALVALLQALASYVESIAIANPEHAAEIVESAGMYAKKAGGRIARTFSAEQIRLGEIEVFCPRAGRNAAYEFQYSLDGGKTWLPTKERIQNSAGVVIDDLPPHTMVHLRYRVVLKSVAQDWSQTISIMVE